MNGCFSLNIPAKAKVLLAMIASVFSCIIGSAQEVATEYFPQDTLPSSMVIEELEITNIEDTVNVDGIPLPPLAIQTNLLYDILLIPNIGVEVGVYENITVGISYHNIWLRNKAHTRWYRTEGLELDGRYYLNKEGLPFKGHHIGVYAQMLTWDITFRKKGRLAERWSYGVGVLYGYNMPIIKDLNLDLEVGMGYLGGRRHRYTPQDGHRVWNSSKTHHWVGPTKIKVTAQWMIDLNKWEWLRRK